MSISENRTLRGAVIDYTSDRTLPLNEAKIYFSPVQAGEGTPSPENVREISGWDSVTLNVNSRLPSEYQEVEYIESTGTQYIDLNFGFHPNDKIIAEFSIDITQNIDKYMVSPNVWNTNNNRFAMGVHNYGKYTAGYGYSATSATMLTPLTINDGNIHKWIYNNRNFSIPELECSKDVSWITFVSETVNLRLFYGYNSNTKGKIKSYHHIKQDGTEINLIPCYRISDHTPGMFDLVTNQFYTNSGTGNFILGPEVGITINFPKTIYGGYVDLIRGEIVETYGEYIFDGDQNISMRNNYSRNGFIAAGRVYLPFPVSTNASDLICDRLPYGNLDAGGVFPRYWLYDPNLTYGGIVIGEQTDYPDITTSAERINLCNEWLQNNPVTVVGKRKNPIIHSISPQDLRLLRGANKFSSNLNGDIEISFAAEEYPQYTGSTVTFNSPVAGKQFEECKVYFSPVQEGEGTPSPENIRPIRGWDGIEVTVCGKNLLDFSAIQWTNGYYLGNINNCDGKAKSGASYKVSEFVPCSYLANQTVTIGFMANPGAQNYVSCCFYTDANEDSYIEDAFITYGRRATGLTVPPIAKYMRFSMLRTASTESQWFGLKSQIDSYEPYIATTLTVPFPKTIYGGYVDLVKGEVVETYGKYELIGNENDTWGMNGWATGQFWYRTLGDTKGIPFYYANTNYTYCNMKSIRNQSFYPINNEMSIMGTEQGGTSRFRYVIVGSAGFGDTIDECKSKLQELNNNGTPFTIVSKLISSLVASYPIDPETLTTLRNTNTLFSNANGNITVRAIGNVPASTHSMDFVRRENTSAPHIESKTGNYITFNTDMEMPLTSGRVYFTPKQDLHGYSKPWVGGSGKNLLNLDDLIAAEQGTFTDGTAFKHLLTLELKPNTAYTLSSSYANANSRVLYFDTSSSTRAAYNGHPVTVTTDETGVVNIGLFNRSGVELFENKSVTVQLELGSTATTYEPYENICPIEGWDGIEVTRCGKNLISANEWKRLMVLSSSTVYEDDNGQYIQFANYRQSTPQHFAEGLIKENTRYTFIITTNATSSVTVLVPYYSDGTYDNISVPAGFATTKFTTPVNKTLVSIRVQQRATTVKFYLDESGLFEGDFNGFEPYQSTSLTIQFPHTIYGGYVDLVSGEVVEDQTCIDMGNYTWGKNWGCWTTNSSSIAIHTYADSSKADVMSDIYKTGYVTSAGQFPNTPEDTIVTRNGFTHIGIKDSDYTTAEDFKAGATGHQLVFRRAVPNTYPLTLTPITTLSGTNNLWTTANGDAEISYYRHSDDSYQYINAQAIASNDNYLLVTDDGFVIGNEENVTIY